MIDQIQTLGVDGSATILAESDATNPSFNGKKIVLNIDATQEKAADICGAVDAMLVMDSRLLKYDIPGMV